MGAGMPVAPKGRFDLSRATLEAKEKLTTAVDFVSNSVNKILCIIKREDYKPPKPRPKK
jgi:hypothetical protein